ncbi:MAG: LL-diaminopimelate aminotransferase [SAR202 cluster bacterium]|nr:LL-diaminopimelate aminotransferase [SAR202 cluster bacterium]|tara:strand:- start:2197 stop:3363 length:1167 start_codon:yes stop_codon:yes gene_type:complete
MKTAERIAKLPPYLFVEVTRKINEKRAQGEDVVSLAIGDPDIPTPQHIIDAMNEALKDTSTHRYPESDGLPEFRQSVADWYSRRFDVKLNPDTEVLPTIGSKEAIGHLAFCYIDPGDIALVPDPGYPVYSIGTMLAGGETFWLPLSRENRFLPDLNAIPEDIARKAKLIWLNYPNNPTAATADLPFFEKIVDFAKKYDILVCHDGPYTEVAFDDYEPVSFLQANGAKDVGIEFHSLSKSFNMTGWRIGMAVGNADAIDALMRIKSNLDSGIFNAVQLAGIAALEGPQDAIKDHNVKYQQRRDKLIPVLRNMGLEVDPPKGSLYVWAKLPDNVKSGDFAAQLIDAVNVVVTPGRGYGEAGEGFIRCSLTVPDDQLDRAIDRLSQFRLQR